MCHAFTYLHLLGFYAPCVNFQSVSKYSVGILYAMFYLSTLCYNFSRSFFAATMSMKHFQVISAFLEFDVRKTRVERWKHDKFACMRYIFDKFNCKFAKGQNPNLLVATDEMLCPYKGHISFKQYNSSKLS